MKKRLIGTRKIFRLNRSCVICLPQNWMDFAQLEEGDYVALEVVEDGTLIVRDFEKYMEGEHETTP